MAVAQAQAVIGRDNVIWSFGPDIEPVVEVEPGAVVRIETNDCFTGQIRSEDDLVTEIDFERINGATGPVAVKGAEPGDSLVVELLEVKPIEWGVATLIPGYGQLHDRVQAPMTRVFKVEDGWVEMDERIRFRHAVTRRKAGHVSASMLSGRPLGVAAPPALLPRP